MSIVTAVLIAVVILAAVVVIVANVKRDPEPALEAEAEAIVVPEPTLEDLRLARLIRGTYYDLPYRDRVEAFEPVEWTS